MPISIKITNKKITAATRNPSHTLQKHATFSLKNDEPILRKHRNPNTRWKNQTLYLTQTSIVWLQVNESTCYTYKLKQSRVELGWAGGWRGQIQDEGWKQNFSHVIFPEETKCFCFLGDILGIAFLVGIPWISAKRPVNAPCYGKECKALIQTTSIPPPWVLLRRFLMIIVWIWERKRRSILLICLSYKWGMGNSRCREFIGTIGKWWIYLFP